MGIPHLTRHLRPLGGSVVLGDTRSDTSSNDLRQIRSVVIDGPSLVFHIYVVLRSWADPNCNPVDAQPTCDEVSVGVLQFLLHLMKVGVAVEQIYFDGALPIAKRKTRLERLEESRRQLEVFYLSSLGGFKESSVGRPPMRITPEHVFSQRATPIRAGQVSQAAFIVSSVLEDLKYRWTPAAIHAQVSSGPYVPRLEGVDDSVSIFRDITHIVFGEADGYCAEIAKNQGSAILSQDSDLFVYDLGNDGSVVFLNSLHLVEGEVRGVEIRPRTVAETLGVKNIQSVAFEVKRDPQASLKTIVQRAKSDLIGDSVAYKGFLKEYQSPPEAMQLIRTFDPRTSELHAQYLLQEFMDDTSAPHVYLPVMVEDYSRRAACTWGQELRQIAYSLLNLSFPMSQRKEGVIEYMRRGKRIAPAQLLLMEEEHCHAQLVELWTKIEMVRNVCSSVSSAEELWKVIALCEVFAENQKERLSPRRLIRYLQNRYCGEKLDWNDIHLQAQTEAVLYSFKILNDITAVALPKLDEGKMKEAATACLEHLHDLPPIQAVSTARLERPLAQKAAEHISTILDSMEETASDGEEGDEEMPDAVEWELPKVSKKAAKENNPPAKSNPSKKPVNLFELLQSG